MRLRLSTLLRHDTGSDEGKLRAAAAAVQAMTALRSRPWTVQALQEYFPDTSATTAPTGHSAQV